MTLSSTITLYRDLFPTIEELKKKQRNLWDGHDPCSSLWHIGKAVLVQ